MCRLLFISLIISCNTLVFSQKQVSITIDDIPNTHLKNPILLQKIDSLQLPVTIFINESKLNQHEDYSQNLVLLELWCKNEYITLGNHTYSHARASATNINEYRQEIVKGEKETRILAEKHGKTLKHFRFPYNDLGKDSLQQDSLKHILNKLGYQIAPFTIESSDWMFNAVYCKYLNEGNTQKANEIGKLYINYTLELFDFYDSVAYAQYNREIKQVYLCHDNEINRDFIDILYQKLKEKEYSFISFDSALQDPMYKNTNYYHHKYGLSWFYRWVSTKKERYNIGHLEPVCSEIDNEYKAIK